MGVKMENAVCSASWVGEKCIWKPVEDEYTQLMRLMSKALASADEDVVKPEHPEVPKLKDAPTCAGSEKEASHYPEPKFDKPGASDLQPQQPLSRSNNREKARLKSTQFMKHFRDFQAKSAGESSTTAFINIMDFAGQEAFTVIQHMLINNRRCGHAVVFDVCKSLDAIADMTMCIDGVEHPIVNTTGKTNFDILEEWLMVLYEAGGGECPIYLVACKIDRIRRRDREGYKQQVRNYLWRNLKGKPYESIVDDIIFVDNTKSGNFFFADEAVTRFRDRFLSDVLMTEALSEMVPLCWLPFTVALHSLVEQRRPVLRLGEAINLAEEIGGCTTKSEALDLLHCHHQLGHLLHFRDNADLRQYVVVDMHWLISIVSALLVPCHDARLQHKKFRSHYALLYEKGILVESLIQHMWQTHCPAYANELLDGELSQLVFTLMEEFALLFSTKHTVAVNDEEPCRKYLMPSMVTSQMEVVPARFSSDRVVYSPPLYLLAKLKKLFRKTVFWRLAVGLMLHFREEKPNASRDVEPTFYQNALRLLVDDDYWLEIQHFATGLGLTVQYDADDSAGPGDAVSSQWSMEAVCQRTLALVEKKLDSLEESGPRSLELDRASVCPCTLGLARCTKHSTTGCSRMECQHFIRLQKGMVPRCPLADRRRQEIGPVISTWMPTFEASVTSSRDSVRDVSGVCERDF